MLSDNFAEATKLLIAESRRVAIELGYDYISTIHFLLADCRLKPEYSIINFAFTTSSEHLTFLSNQSINTPSLLVETLPLTVEAELTIKKALKLWGNGIYRNDMIYPYHLFLAAAQIQKTFFYSIFTPNNRLLEKLENYYIEIGQLKREDINKGLFTKLFKGLFNTGIL